MRWRSTESGLNGSNVAARSAASVVAEPSCPANSGGVAGTVRMEKGERMFGWMGLPSGEWSTEACSSAGRMVALWMAARTADWRE